MNKLLLTAFSLTTSLLITTTSAADNDKNLVDERPAAPQSQTQQEDVNKDSSKKSTNKANTKKSTYQKTKSKDKGMHIKDDVTSTVDNEPVDAVETKSPSPNKSNSE